MIAADVRSNLTRTLWRQWIPGMLGSSYRATELDVPITEARILIDEQVIVCPPPSLASSAGSAVPASGAANGEVTHCLSDLRQAAQGGARGCRWANRFVY
jgi:hypothetical protein